MIVGRKDRFAIEAEVHDVVDGWVLGGFRFWLCGRPVGDWDDTADLKGCVRWLRDFASMDRDRHESRLAAAPAREVFERLYDPVMGEGGNPVEIPDAYARFHISYIGMSSFDRFDMLLLYDEHGWERCLWRRADSDGIEECRLEPGEMETVARQFCDRFEQEITSS